MNKKLRIFFSVLFFLSFSGQLYMFLFGEADYAILLRNLCSGILMLIVWAALWRSSTFRHTVYCRFSYCCLALLLIGALFKMSHWENADEFIFMGCLGTGIFYCIHFGKKRPKGLMDFIKMIYLEVLIFTIGAVLFGLELKGLLFWVLAIASCALMIVFYIELLEKRELQELALAEEGDNIFRYPDP